MKFLGTAVVVVCLALAATVMNAQAQSVSSTHSMFGGAGGLGGGGGGFGRTYYGTDTRWACARYGKLQRDGTRRCVPRKVR